jgi:hypothetical protein
MVELGNLLGLGLSINSGTAQQYYQNAHDQMLQQQAAQYQNNSAAFMAGLANTGSSPSNVTPIRHERTPEEIAAQLEARYAEMVEEAERKAKAALTACSICRWSDGAWCHNPLVIGFDQKSELVADRGELHSKLCGPEKALWEPVPPRRNLWQRFVDWFLEPWAEDLATTDKKA